MARLASVYKRWVRLFKRMQHSLTLHSLPNHLQSTKEGHVTGEPKRCSSCSEAIVAAGLVLIRPFGSFFHENDVVVVFFVLRLESIVCICR